MLSINFSRLLGVAGMVSLLAFLSGCGSGSTSLSSQTSSNTYMISGTVNNVSASGGVAGVTVKLNNGSGTTIATTTTDTYGNYSFSSVANGSYTVAPSDTGNTFSPANSPESVNNSDITLVNFTDTSGGWGAPTIGVGQAMMGGAIQGAVLTLSNSVSTPTANMTATAVTTDGTYLYMIQGTSVVKASLATGAVTSIAPNVITGTGTGAANGDEGITTDGVNIYVADSGGYCIHQINIASGTDTIIAGTPGAGGMTDGPGVSAQFQWPTAITTDGTNLYVVDVGNNNIRMISLAAGYTVSTIAGSTTGVTGNANGTGSGATFSFGGNAGGITTDGSNLYVADSGNNLIRKIALAAGYTVSTIAGTGTAGTVDGVGTVATLTIPDGITTDGKSLYIVDNHYGPTTLRKIAPSSGTLAAMTNSTAQVTTLAGANGTGNPYDGIGAAADLSWATRITTDGTSLYLAGDKIRKVY